MLKETTYSMQTTVSTGKPVVRAGLHAEKSYWLEQLASLHDLPHLMPDYVWSQQSNADYGVLPLQVPAALYRKLCQVTHASPFLLYVLLAAATGICMHKYTGSETVLIGSPALQECEQANILPIKEHINEHTSLQHLLQQVRTVLQEAYKRQRYPWHRLLKDLSLPESTPASPFLDVVVALTNIHGEMLQIGQGITLTFTLQEDGLTGQVEFHKQLFSRQSAERFASRLLQVLYALAGDLRASVGHVDIRTEHERYQFLASRTAAQDAQLSETMCVHQAFEMQAAHVPEKIALVCDEAQITYQELDRRANQVAHSLRALGVGPETLVGLCVERSLEMVVGILAILKAGGAYVPLDPAYPRERLDYMIKDTQIAVLVTQQRVAETLPTMNVQMVCLDNEWQTISQEQSELCSSQVQPDNLAYVIYTSGSTGRPKGVGISHRNVMRLFAATHAWFSFNTQDTWTLFHSYAFDFSVWELWGALLHGGRLIVVPYLVSRTPEAFHTLLCTNQVTVLNQTPSAFRQLMQADATASTGALSLRYVIFGGEALDLPGLQPWFARHGDQQPQLVNMYGITETTVHVTYRPLTQTDTHATPGSMIGQPIPDLHVYILDQRLQPVPDGVAGELYVGGAGVARGYLNNPDLTALRFISDPFSGVPGARLYRTGDLARRRADGDIEYLGRIDQQVKIRGFRIELGEIEATLSQHPDVHTTVVLPQEDASGNKRLVAYVVLRSGVTVSTGELRSFLQTTLPDYMLPSTFLLLDALPLTPNGKLDRKALLALDATHTAARGEAFVAPRTPAEEILADIWTEVLGLEQVGVYDNFFEAGGDSILSIQVVARANEAGLHLSTKQLFEYQTIAELAASTPQVIQAEQGIVTGPVFLTPIQKWFFEQTTGNLHHWNQSLLLKVGQPLVIETLEQVMSALLLHHDALRTRFTQSEEGWQQYISEPEQTVPVLSFSLEHLSPQEQQEAIETTSQHLQGLLHLEQGPVVRVVYFHMGTDQEDRLLLIAHHLIIDGVSWRILLKDIETLYTQLQQGKPVKLPAKSTSYQYWSEQLREYAASSRLLDELPYWQTVRKQSAFIRHAEALATSNTEASCRTVSRMLSVKETHTLLHTVPKVYQATIHDVLLSVLLQAWQRWTGEQGLLLDLEGHGREPLFDDVDLSRTVGWFTSIYPLSIEAPLAATPDETITAVKACVRAIPAHGVGYGILRYLHEDAATQTMLKSLPSAQVSFNYLGQFDHTLGAGAFFTEAPEYAGPNHSGDARRRYALEIIASILGGQLRLSWNYSHQLHTSSAIETLAEHYMDALHELITHCQSPVSRNYTPADFQGARVSQKDLDTLLSHFHGTSGKKVQ